MKRSKEKWKWQEAGNASRTRQEHASGEEQWKRIVLVGSAGGRLSRGNVAAHKRIGGIVAGATQNTSNRPTHMSRQRQTQLALECEVTSPRDLVLQIDGTVVPAASADHFVASERGAGIAERICCKITSQRK